MINQQNLVKHLANLVTFETIAGNIVEQKKCLEYIKEQFSFYPFHINEYEHDGHPSLVLTTTDTKHPEIFLAAHIDVVPAKETMFAITQNDDILSGRGVCDMKFTIATYICVLQEIYAQTKKLPSLGLMFTSEEEIEGNNGPGFLLNEKGYSADIAFIPDGGDNWHIVKEAKGILVLSLQTSGKNAHGSTPWKGESAISKLFTIGQTLQTMYPSLSEDTEITINFGKINGGKAVNQVADHAALVIDIRFSSHVKKEQITSDIKTAFPDVGIEIFDGLPAFSTDIENPYVKKWAALIKSENPTPFMKENGATDGPFFSEKNIPVIISKPEGGAIHSEDEWISIKSWITFSEKLKQFLLNN